MSRGWDSFQWLEVILLCLILWRVWGIHYVLTSRYGGVGSKLDQIVDNITRQQERDKGAE